MNQHLQLARQYVAMQDMQAELLEHIEKMAQQDEASLVDIAFLTGITAQFRDTMARAEDLERKIFADRLVKVT